QIPGQLALHIVEPEDAVRVADVGDAGDDRGMLGIDGVAPGGEVTEGLAAAGHLGGNAGRARSIGEGGAREAGGEGEAQEGRADGGHVWSPQGSAAAFGPLSD